MDFTRHAHDWLDAWNAHDLERILAHYAEAVEFYSPFVAKLTGQASGVLHGKTQLRDYFARGLTSYPELNFKFIRVYSGMRSCVLEYLSVNQLRAAEAMEFDAAGKIRRVQAHYAAE